MKNDKISIKEIARLAGTSVATVSRVINQNGRFSKETEQRVLKVIEEYGYRPNMLAQGLRQDRMNVIGVIVPDITSDFFAAIVREIEKELFQRGYIALLCDTHEREDMEARFIDMLSNLRFSGIIYVGGKRTQSFFEDLPAVYIDRLPTHVGMEPHSCFIGSDNFQGGYIAARRLLESGRRQPAIVLYENELETQRQRYMGYRRALEEFGLADGDSGAYYVDSVDFDNGFLVTSDLLKAGRNHDAIFYTSDILAIGGLRCLHENGISIPDQIAVIGMDDIPLSARVTPPLTTVRQPFRDFGRLAVKTLVRMLDGEQVENQILKVELIERDTV